MKRIRYFMFSLCVALLCTGLTGCADGLLDEIPRDFTMLWEETEDAAEAFASPEVVPEREEAPAVCFLMEEAGSYAYESLNETERIWYRDIESILGTFGTEVRLSQSGLAGGLADTDIDRIFQCVLSDHPELFYVEGYSYVKYARGEKITAIEFSGTYPLALEEAISREGEIRAAADALLAGISSDASDYEKVKYVYDTLIRNTDYDLDAPDNQNIYSVFVRHMSVCQGYAKATQYLLNRLGVECTLVLGTVETGEGHAWNLVKVDGAYYYLDTTWGDVSYRTEDMASAEGTAAEEKLIAGGEPSGSETSDAGEMLSGNSTPGAGDGPHGGDMPGDGAASGSDAQDAGESSGAGGGQPAMPEINYDYLNVTTAELLRTHSIGGEVPMPLCTATAANYYVREGALFTAYDRGQMEALFQKAAAGGQQDITIKCADAACYGEILEALIEEQEIFDYLPDEESRIAYAQNEKQHSLTFWVTNE